MAIYLIRHGETASNRARVIQLPETPLSGRGLGQARRLAERLAGEGIARIVSSDLARARMTAECLVATTGAPLEHDEGLQERNFGEIRGTAYADVGCDPFGPDYAPPGGESWPVFHERVDRAWRRIGRLAAECDGHLAVVTHGLVCHSIVARHVEWPSASDRPGPDDPPLHFGNTALTILAGPDPWRAEILGCTEHLGEDLSGDLEGTSGL